MHLLFVLILIWAVSHGIESLARSGELFLPLVALFVLFLIVFIIPQGDPDRLRPVFGTGLEAIIQGATVTVATRLESLQRS